MTRFERRRYFERLCELRDAYLAAGRLDDPGMTIADVIAYGEQLMADPALLDAVMGAEPARSAGASEPAG